MNRTGLLVLLLLVASFGLSAQTVEILLLVSADGGGTVSFQESLLDGCMDAAFEAGRIVTSGKPKEADRNSYESWNPSDTVNEGYIDQILLVFASYIVENKVYILKELECRLIELKTGNTLAKAEVKPFPASSTAVSDIEKANRESGFLLASRLFNGKQ